MNKRPGKVVVTTEVGFCSFCGRPRNLRREDHQLGALVRSIVTCETCHRTLSSTVGVASAEPVPAAEDKPAAPVPAAPVPAAPLPAAARPTSPASGEVKKARPAAKKAAAKKPAAKAKAPVKRTTTKSATKKNK